MLLKKQDIIHDSRIGSLNLTLLFVNIEKKETESKGGEMMAHTDLPVRTTPLQPWWKRALLELKKQYFFYLLVIPGLVMLIMFSYIPMTGIYMAFTDYTYRGGIFGSEFVGLKNFRFLLASRRDVLRAVRNTLVLNVGGMFIGLAFNVFVALILGEISRERYRKGIQTAILFPHFLSWIVVGALATVLLDSERGIINQAITALGGERIIWGMSPQYWWAILIISSVWKGFGYGSIVYYAVLTGFDPGIFEAAKIDGANRFQRLTKISLPLLKPTVCTMLLLSIGGLLGSSLEQIMGMTQLTGSLLSTTDTISTYIYRTTMNIGNYGMSSAVSLFQSLVGFLLVIIANMLVKKMDPEYGLF